MIQCNSQVTSRVHALRGMWACEHARNSRRCRDALRNCEQNQNHPRVQLLLHNLPERLLLRVPAQSWYSLYIKFTSQNIVTCSYNIFVPYTVHNCYECLVGGPFTVLSYSQGSWNSKYKQHCWVEYDSTSGVRQLIKCPACSCCTHGVSCEIV